MVNIAGTWRSDFSRNLRRDGHDVADLTREAVAGVLDDAGIGPSAIESIHVGNAFGGLYNGQTHLGAMPATVEPALWGVPAARHEGACASSSLAILAATAEIEAGRYDCVLVLGIEQERTMPGAEAARVQQAAAWVGPDTDGVELIWPATFDRIADAYDARFGLDETHLRAIGRLTSPTPRTTPSPRPATGSCRRTRSAPTTGSTRWSRAVCGATTAARSPTAPPRWCWCRTAGSPTADARRRA